MAALAARSRAKAKARAPKSHLGTPAPAERTYRQLRQRILDNKIPPGTYREEALARDLGAHRNQVHAAVMRLSQERLVDFSHGELRVRPISADDMREIYEILIALEPLAARSAARRQLKRADVDSLQTAVQQMDAALLKDDLMAWVKADELFHARLIELCGNRRLATIIASYWDDLHRVRMQTLGALPFPVASNRDHAAVVDAVRRGDADAAYGLHYEHLKRALASVLAALARRDGQQHP
jgi:DNA-binding GntR family transcriptional regulator